MRAAARLDREGARLVTLPAAIAAEIETELGQRINQTTPVSGGCIHTALRLQTDLGTCFVKYGDARGGVMFETESIALEEIGATETVRVPRVIARGSRWFLLEWLEPGPPSREAWRAFGAALARMHRVRHDRF